MDPAAKRAAFERLKELAGNGRLVPEKRKAFTTKERALIHERAQGQCEDCGKRVGLSGWHGDHIIPLFRGGKHEPANWQLLCTVCHENKTGIEAAGNAKCRRIEDREVNGPKPAQIKSRNEWPTGQKLRSRNSFQKRPA